MAVNLFHSTTKKRAKAFSLNYTTLFSLLLILLICSFNYAQKPKGKLFIIGGGNRSDGLMNQLLSISELKKKDYIAVLPMSSEEPDSAFIYFKKQVEKLTPNLIVMLNFNKQTANNEVLVDSLKKAKLIFMSGGDQSRFMGVVHNTLVYRAIYEAYANGSTISGTSAGAAVMCENMITGNQKLKPEYSSTFDNIRFNNLETAPGLGLIKNVIIDQHFLKRSRYNRLLSALVEFPTHIGIGIDESTAIIVRNNEIEIVGESEVVVMKNTKGITKVPKNNTIGIKSLEMSIYYEGQKFKIK